MRRVTDYDIHFPDLFKIQGVGQELYHNEVEIVTSYLHNPFTGGTGKTYGFLTKGYLNKIHQKS
jgi:hypothetical protein